MTSFEENAAMQSNSQATTGVIEQNLAAQGITVHVPAPGVANYLGFARSGNLLFVTGQACFDPQGELLFEGKVGDEVTMEQGIAAARVCGLNLLAQVKAAIGDLDKVVRVIRIGGYVASAPDFFALPTILDGASDLMVQVFGDKGRHARTTIGVANLPGNAAVEVDAVFEVV
ncbi:MAG: RidA family protein [Mucilaginibacter sp.]|uniref:RidA family protein n=1 Tax=Mucilaginibacter sp. TaxID=1882438 RepID=UPI0031AF14A8